jgi:hypothetical protein
VRLGQNGMASALFGIKLSRKPRCVCTKFSGQLQRLPRRPFGCGTASIRVGSVAWSTPRRRHDETAKLLLPRNHGYGLSTF